MLKAYAMALAVSTAAPVVEKDKQTVEAPTKNNKAEAVLVDTTKTDFVFGKKTKKEWWFY